MKSLVRISNGAARKKTAQHIAGLLTLLGLFLAADCLGVPASRPIPPPSIEFGDLYRDVEMAGVFDDQKTFADAIPRQAPWKIMADFAGQKWLPRFSLKSFVTRHFKLPPRKLVGIEQKNNRSVAAYISDAWSVLQHKPGAVEPYSSLLPLSHPYIVPGGRFSEIYYWDSYFSMLGLEQDGRHSLARDMLANMASLIKRYGHIPNGNRSYYLSRSQPPFFASMVELIAARDGPAVFRTYLPQLQAEYNYWMEGADGLAPGAAHRHVVRLRDGTLLNRYWDDRAVPRDESYRQDVLTSQNSRRPASEVWRDLRAGSESGWDFSSRWLADGAHLWTIRTTDIAPVDLNSLMVHMEHVLAQAYRETGDPAKADLYESRAKVRRAAIRRLMWNEQAGMFADYLLREERQSPVLSAATVYPLFFNVATQKQAHAIAIALRRTFLKPGGLATTLSITGQQWDRPNGWAPLQYLAIEGLNAYGERRLAREIAARWIRTDIASFRTSGTLVEKYDIERQPNEAGGGEYTLQVGFGWTNGVLAKLMAQYPKEATSAELSNGTRPN